ncbi:MAG: hypothetical protein D6705_16335 [Deltaproteobacteria bacterium]|nr:MAG: hypothetical protein D6705_16335 [Deltaproteobacteria bacterium]
MGHGIGRRRFVALCGAACVAACRPRDGTDYPRTLVLEDEMVPDVLAPKTDAVQVPRAKIRLGVHRGRLAFLAQRPNRFRGTVTVAGQEVLSLALSELGYQLVDKLGEPAGYYEGRDGGCAIARLAGARLRPEAFVSMVCGGAPVAGAFTFARQGYDPQARAEHVVVRDDQGSVDLWLRPATSLAGMPWVVVRARLPGGVTARLDGWDRVEGVLLPRHLVLEASDRRQALDVQVREVDPHPSWASSPVGEKTPETKVAGSGREDPSSSVRDPEDAWEDGGAWENAPPDPAEPPPPDPSPPAASSEAPEGLTETVPARFRLTPPDGLPRRRSRCD